MATGTITPNKSIAGTISKKTVGGTIVAGGSADHNRLTNRDKADQQSIIAVIKSQDVLAIKVNEDQLKQFDGKAFNKYTEMAEKKISISDKIIVYDLIKKTEELNSESK